MHKVKATIILEWREYILSLQIIRLALAVLIESCMGDGNVIKVQWTTKVCSGTILHFAFCLLPNVGNILMGLSAALFETGLLS